MSLAPGPSPSGVRGDLILQPNYFTSSLFVDQFRDDLELLISSFCTAERHNATTIDTMLRPFESFKGLWVVQGWGWLHFRTFDARARRTLIAVVFRLFLERTKESEPLDTRAAALFALYMFFSTQPESSYPPMYRLKYIGIPVDVYQPLLQLPAALNDNSELKLLAPYCSQMILTLSSRFTILPSSDLGPYNPPSLPREIFVPDNAEEAELPEENPDAPKKKGRPSKKEALRRTRAAVTSLGKWLENTTVPDGPDSAHNIMSNAPATLREAYLKDKQTLLDLLDDEHGQIALARANASMLARLRVIDERAAARGMEVGSEGGDRTGMGRAERAVSELGKSETRSRGGLLGLMEGAGLDVRDE
ncbi:hypothetical protein K488DRAFT_40686 [Vararia minispora EC-137]|uniref:Uncharacterized protein n=1 Tax=Vararia minispora EC-137 TaxID=1314806 RepID=A0ACB8QZ32_9AGAM|nr:hypothetical protein K488DRAFT_40686 [Vararia minispora EC-137]